MPKAMTAEQRLDALRKVRSKALPVSSLETHEALQPRNSRLIPFRDKGRAEDRSAEHIGHMRLALEGAKGQELEPILAAKIGDAIYVIDGHHRLEAYERAKRATIPARVASMSLKRAALLSKLANCTGRALEMHPEQRRDAAWQYLAAITHAGSKPRPPSESYRRIAGRFGIGHATVQRMLRRLPHISPSEWSREALDEGTRFPRWRYVREQGQGWREMKEMLTPDQLTQHQAEKLAERIGALLEKATPEVQRLAKLMLANEQGLAALDKETKEFLEVTEDYGF
jgi:ParB-like chromosome segregation protein Spo0J